MNRYPVIILLVMVMLGPMRPDASAVLPMREQWRQSCKALEQGDAAMAVTLFREFEEWYGAEPEANEEAFRNDRWRLHGLACLQAGFSAEGMELLDRWLAATEVSAPFHAYIRFQMGITNLSTGRPDRAIYHWKIFLENHGQLPECILVHWMWSDLELSSGNTEAALQHMQAVLQAPGLQPAVRALARSAAALINLGNDSADTAATILEEDSGAAGSRIFMLWRSLLAAPVVQALLQKDMPGKAASATEWFQPPDTSQAQLLQLLSSLKEQSQSVYRNRSLREALWRQHWSRQLEKLDRILGQLDSSQDLGMLYILKMEALLKAGKNHEAACLSGAIIRPGGLTEKHLMAHAYKAAIRASQQLSQWKQARLLADAFLAQYPEDEALPEILLLNARTAAGSLDFVAALDQVRNLLVTYPAHPARASWNLLKGAWLLSSGRGEAALACFESLQESAPESWVPYIQFQKGRCRESLNELQKAVAVYTSVRDCPAATPVLSEFAATSILKIHLRQMQTTKFLSALNTYRKQYPDGTNRHMAENLAGSFHLATGETSKAEACFRKVSLQSHPASAYAHEQLSLLYRNSKDINALIEHAIGWIRQYRSTQENLPETPFTDSLFYWRETGNPPLPDPLLLSLLDDLEAPTGLLPGQTILSIAMSGWNHYKSSFQGSPEDPLEWIESKAEKLFRSGNMAAYATYMFHLADCLETEDRLDSADTKRIQVLQAVNPEDLDEYILLGISRTADRYDFPESIGLLQTFLERFPGSDSRPEALYLLATRYQNRNETETALPLFREIISDWPGSPACVPSGIALARHLVDTGSFSEGRSVALDLLEKPNIAPHDSAVLLLILAESGFSMDLPEKAALACMRIMKLYPDYHDTYNSARSLLLENRGNILNPEQENFINSLEDIDETAT